VATDRRVLVSARRKLEWARQHVATLEREIASFTATLPDPDEVDEDDLHLYLVPKIPEPPEHLALIVGDAVQNLRAALDHAVYALSVDREPGLKESSTEFPIYNTAAGFARAGKGKIKHLSDPARVFVEAQQPYNDSGPEKGLLWFLHNLSNTDKHRRIPLVLTYVRSHRTTITQGGKMKIFPEGIIGATTQGSPIIGTYTIPGQHYVVGFEKGILIGPGVAAQWQRVLHLANLMLAKCEAIVDSLEMT
jgi:hypothetical protein